MEYLLNKEQIYKIFENDSKYVNLNIYDFKSLYAKINKECFDDSLPIIPIIIKTIKSATAKYTAKLINNKPIDSEIIISNLCHFTEEKLKNVMCHEMIHFFVAINYGPREGHGPNFKSNMYRVNKLGYNVTLTDDEITLVNQDIAVGECIFITGIYKGNLPFYVLIAKKNFLKLSVEQKQQISNTYNKEKGFTDIKYYETTAPDIKLLRVSKDLLRCGLIKSQYKYLIDNVVKSDKTKELSISDILN